LLHSAALAGFLLFGASARLGPIYFVGLAIVGADGKVFLVSQDGTASVVDAKGEWEILSVNPLDDEVFALRASSAGRDATRAMGSRLLKTWQQLRPHESVGVVLQQRPRLTLPVAFGVVSAASEVPVRAALEGFIYTRLAAIVSGAMRLMPLGQGEGHGLLSDMLTSVPTVADQILADDGPLTSFTPVMDVMVMSQQYVESRLFKS
jgi:urease accessory protein